MTIPILTGPCKGGARLIDKRDILLIAPVLVAFLVLGLVYTWSVPMWEAPDEPSHFSTIEYIASTGRIPPPDAQVLHRGVAVNATGEPPVYFLFAALLWLPWSQTDVAVVPNDSYGRTPERNHFLQRGPEVREEGGLPGALRVLRLSSVVMGSATVLLVFLLAKRVWAGEPWRPLTAAILAGFTPQFLFMSSAIGNDALANLIACATLLWLLKIQNDPAPLPPRSSLIAAGLLSAGALTKLSLASLIPAAVVAVLLRRRRDPRVRPGRELLSLLVPVAVVAVWVLLLSPTWSIHWIRELWTRTTGSGSAYASLSGLWALVVGTKNTFWGRFGWVNVPLHPYLIDLLDLLTLWAVVGLAILVVGRGERPSGRQADGLLILIAALGMVLLTYVKTNLAVSRYLQGRHLFPALGAWAILAVAGIWNAGGRKLRRFLPWGLLVLMSALNVAGIRLSLVPAYEHRLPGNLAIDASQSTGGRWLRLGGDVPRVGQSFHCSQRGLTRIDVYATPEGRRRSADLVLHLRRTRESDVDLRVARTLGPTWSTAGYASFTFSAVPGSPDEDFYFFVEPDLATGRSPLIWYADANAYAAGSMYVGDEKWPVDLRFTSYCME